LSLSRCHLPCFCYYLLFNYALSFPQLAHICFVFTGKGTHTHTRTEKGGSWLRWYWSPQTASHLFQFSISPTNWMHSILPHYLCLRHSNCSYSANARVQPQPTVIHTKGRKRKFVFALFYAFFDNTHTLAGQALTHTQTLDWSSNLFILEWQATSSPPTPIGLHSIYLGICHSGTFSAALVLFRLKKKTSRSA